jgi:hypothetical protein
MTTHILNTVDQPVTKTLCGTVGTAVYKPTDSDCEACLKQFNKQYPGSYETWVKKNNKTKTPKNTNGVEGEIK